MERYRVRANYKGNQSPRHNFNSTSSSHISLPPKPPISSYLQPQTPKPTAPNQPVDDAEISIFEAERYFNEGDEALNKKKAIILNGLTDSFDASTNPRDSWASSVDGYGRNFRNRSFRATPTASSEASWNSQTGLLANRPGSVAVNVKAYPLNETKKGSFPGRKFFRRNCPCYGKKSVDVEERNSEPRTPTRSRYGSSDSQASVAVTKTEMEMESMEVAKVKIWANEPPLLCPEKKFPTAEVSRRIVNSAGGGFSFPVLSPEGIKGGEPEEPARESLEVYRPGERASTLKKTANEMMPPTRLPPMFSDPDLQSRTVPDDDAMSDTSSDLFEIESFSANSTGLYRRRESLDDLPRIGNETLGILQLRRNVEEQMVPSECYAPSEVSVEWSVTTADGGFDRTSVANFSSSASDFGDNRFVPVDSPAGNGGGELKKRGGGGLLNCRCEKAVSVGPNPVRFPDQQQRVPTGPGVFPSRSRPVQT